MGDNYFPTTPSDHAHGSTSLTANFFLGDVGEVVLAHTSNGFSWKSVEPLHNLFSLPQEESELPCFGTKIVSEKEQEVKFADVYAVELINRGLLEKTAVAHPGGSLLYYSPETHWFRLHAGHKAETQSSRWISSVYTFGYKNLDICRICVNLIKVHFNVEAKRPKNLLVIVTERARHACSVLASMPNRDLGLYDGCIAVVSSCTLLLVPFLGPDTS